MELTRSDIQKLIQAQKESTFLNHFIYSIRKDFKTQGCIQKNKNKNMEKNRSNRWFLSSIFFLF